MVNIDNQPKKKRGRPPKKSATQEQLNTINSGLQELGIATDFDTFVAQYINGTQRQNYASTLKRQIEQIGKLTEQSSHNGTIQPLLSQSLLQDIQFRTKIASSATLEKWLSSPSSYSSELQSVSNWLSKAVGQYNQLIWHANTSKAFCVDLVPLTKEKKVLKLLKKLNIKYQFSKIDLDVMYNGVGFYWFSETDNSFAILPLPKDYCFITAPWDLGFLFTFDLSFFDRMNGLQESIPELATAYKALIKAREAGLQGEDLAPIQYYSVPPDKGWCFTYNPISADKTPPFLSSMSSALDILSYKELLKNNVILSMYRILSMKIPMQKDNSKMSIDFQDASFMVDAIQGSLPDGMTAFASPFDVEAVNVDQVNRLESIVDLGNNSFASSAGMSDAFFGGGAVRQSTALTFIDNISFYKNSFHLYRQYENLVNYLIMTKTVSPSRVHFHGNNLTLQADAKDYSTMASSQNLPVGRLLSYFYEPQDYIATLEAERDLGIKDLLMPIVSAYNTKGGTSENGRPQQDNLTESGTNQRDYGSNDNKE